MRSEYGKLMYLLMDSSEPAVQELLEFRCVCPLRTVHRFLEERGGLALLDDPLMATATAEIVAGACSRCGTAWRRGRVRAWGCRCAGRGQRAREGRRLGRWSREDKGGDRAWGL